MNILNTIYLTAVRELIKEITRTMENPLDFQQRWFMRLVSSGKESKFGSEHNFCKMGGDYREALKYYQENVPVRDYNAFAPYIEEIRKGKEYILWNDKVKWFAKSSGTSSDKSKYIPITPESLNITHYGGFKRMLGWYVANHSESRIFNGKALTLGGSVVPEISGNVKRYSGDLSAVLLKNSPFIVELLRTPSRKSALIADFTKKVEMICRECSRENVTNFSGVPSWNLILLNKILEYTHAQNISEVWPDMELFMHGGIGFAPYREIYKKLIPSHRMHYLENYNASEGYFAFQDNETIDSMLLTVNNGIFYEFIPMDIFSEVISGKIRRIPTLEEVRCGVEYAVVLTSCGGLWRYLIGDCVKFTSLFPHRIQITGRTQLYINAFGEELMISNAEKALSITCRECNCAVSDFTAAPVFMESGKKGYHRWAIEFSKRPESVGEFTERLDRHLTEVNSDYEAKRKNNATMEMPEVIELPAGTFYRWMESRGKAGGQNKVPRLYKDLRFIEELVKLQ